ncbi:MAG TPA: DNA helicase RecG [Desulfotomaculum sp.]|nr:DNA helicase RecG [Desulfotomaculum sp.]
MFSDTNNYSPASYSVQYLKTVGPRRAVLLRRLGIQTVKDLLYYFPRDYEDRSQIKPVYKCVHGEQATLAGTVTGMQELNPRRGLTITRLVLSSETGIFYGVWFNQPYIKKQLSTGLKVLLTGKIELAFGRVQVQVTDFEILNGGELLHDGRIVPVYSLTEQLSQRLLRGIIKIGLDEWTGKVREFLPAGLIDKYSLPVLPRALSQIHFPSSYDEAQRAKERFVFEELFLLQAALALRRKRLTRQYKPHRYAVNPSLVQDFLQTLPFALTADQNRVWYEISREMDQPYPVYRLLQGDVGAGKTIVSILFLLKTAGSGLQGALMVPTEILAGQHFLNLRRLLSPLGIQVGLLSGSLKKKERTTLLEQLQTGIISLVVGTHALIQDNVKFKHLAAVVIDEQHRFGVRQRVLLQHKGQLPDVLVMTATPIPRSLALTLYGDLEISAIYELPPGRRPVQTYARLTSDLENVYYFVREQVKKGYQAYIICPLVEESERIDVQAAVELAAELSTAVYFKDCCLALLHGQLKAEEKERIMEAYRCGEVDILVATTVVEVGVDVPNANVMVILDAHRFGLAQLHQLRGRVGRGNCQSYCILVSDVRSGTAGERLAAMAGMTDGFALAEEDLRLRGPGHLTGTRQSGLPEFKIADLVRDWHVLQQARREAVELLENDPSLEDPENSLLQEELRSRFKNNPLTNF